MKNEITVKPKGFLRYHLFFWRVYRNGEPIGRISRHEILFLGKIDKIRITAMLDDSIDDRYLDTDELVVPNHATLADAIKSIEEFFSTAQPRVPPRPPRYYLNPV